MIISRVLEKTVPGSLPIAQWHKARNANCGPCALRGRSMRLLMRGKHGIQHLDDRPLFGGG